MAFKELNYRKVWTSAEDFPTYENDEQQVRADMQYHPDAVKDYINNQLLKELAAKGAAAELGAVNEGAAATVQSVLDAHKSKLDQLKEDIETVASGGTPELVKSTPVSFSAGSWAAVSGAVQLTIPKSDHKRENGNFGYNLYQLVDGVYRSGTWGTVSTRVVYNAGGSIILTADEPYTGKIVFFGL